MEKFENVFLLILWNDILGRFNISHKSVQRADLNLSAAVHILTSLVSYVNDLRDEFDAYEQKAMEKLPNIGYSDVGKRKQVRSRRIARNDGPGEEIVLEGRQKFKIDTFLYIIDTLVSNLNIRLKAYENINNNFGFLIELNSMTSNDIEEKCIKLSEKYVDDLSQSDFIAECQLFKSYIAPEKKNTAHFRTFTN